MKKERGITLSSLLVYIIVMFIVIGAMTGISTMFYNNVKDLDASGAEISKFNTFNSYFVKEIKSPNNSVDTISNSGNYILFKSGNSFIFKNNEIYYNDLKIVSDVDNMTFSYYNNQELNQNHDIVTVNIEFEKYSKQINYKVEEIY